MNFVLDTNVCIDFLKGRSKTLLKRIEETSPKNIFIPVIVRFELYYGAFKSKRREETLNTLQGFIDSFNSIEMDTKIAETAGRIRAELETAGIPIGPYDLLIGASALERGYVLVTRNIKEFSRIPGLSIENWEE